MRLYWWPDRYFWSLLYVNFWNGRNRLLQFNALNRVFSILIIGALFALPATAAQEKEVKLSADSLVFDREQGAFQAEGDVLILRGETTLRADQARWDEKSGNVYCDGSVRMTSPQGVVTADSFLYNFETGQGRMTNGQIAMPGQAYLSGTEIETLGKNSYKVFEGRFTSCAGETPTWSFGAKKIDVDIGHFAQAKHAKFYLYNVPVLYLPYVAFPAKTERSSGFLMPTIGSSRRLGTHVTLPWYQVISKDQDVTLSLDTMSRIGVGTGLEYRYFVNTVAPARLNFNYVTAKSAESDRYLFEWEHDGFLPGDIRLAISSQYVNRNDYFELFGGSTQEYTRDKVQSDLYLSKVFGKTNLTGLGRYTRALQQDTSTVLQTLPEVGLAIIPQRFMATPFVPSLDVVLTNYWRDVGETGTRLYLYPTLSSDAFSTRYLNVLPTISWREQLYRVDGESLHAGRPEASVTVGNRLARVYGRPDDMVASRHEIELQLNYFYAPEVDTTDITAFDFYDEFSAVNRFRLFLDNRWTERRTLPEGPSVYRELVNLRLSVDYDLFEQRRILSLPEEQRHPFSPLVAELEIRPDERIFLRSDVALAIEENPGRMESLAVWGGVNDQAGNGLLLNYNYRRTEFDYLSVSVDFALMSPFYANYEGRFDLQGRKNLDYQASLEYRSGCWSFSGSWYERPDDRGVSFGISLSNITGKKLEPLTNALNKWL
jgi:LPS-assembly protein